MLLESTRTQGRLPGGGENVCSRRGGLGPRGTAVAGLLLSRSPPGRGRERKAGLCEERGGTPEAWHAPTSRQLSRRTVLFSRRQSSPGCVAGAALGAGTKASKNSAVLQTPTDAARGLWGQLASDQKEKGRTSAFAAPGKGKGVCATRRQEPGDGETGPASPRRRRDATSLRHVGRAVTGGPRERLSAASPGSSHISLKPLSRLC